jgi:crotonobetainyl-CoA:carnitine CoA-transferase CaiB-like acyl-CoA transferase
MLLDGVRVIELATSVAAGYCSKVLAELGATVVKIEQPGFGDPLRSVGPFIGSVPDPERSAGFIYLHAGKRSVTLDWEHVAGQEILRRLIERADLLLLDARQNPPAGAGQGRTTVVFQDTGHPAHRHYVLSDLAAYALSGYLYVDGAGDRPPLKGGGPQPAHTAGNYAIMAVLAQRFADRGQLQTRRIVVPVAECMATMHWYTTVMWTYARIKKRRIGNRLDIAHPVSLYPCRDGWVAIGAGGNEAWRLLTIALGRPELAEDERFADAWLRLERADEVDAVIEEWTRARTRAEVMSILQAFRVPCGLVSSLEDLLADPQYQARGYWQRVDQPRVGVLAFPGAPFKAATLDFRTRPAPLLGEHTTAELTAVGLSPEDLRRLRGEHVI